MRKILPMIREFSNDEVESSRKRWRPIRSLNSSFSTPRQTSFLWRPCDPWGRDTLLRDPQQQFQNVFSIFTVALRIDRRSVDGCLLNESNLITQAFSRFLWAWGEIDIVHLHRCQTSSNSSENQANESIRWNELLEVLWRLTHLLVVPQDLSANWPTGEPSELHSQSCRWTSLTNCSFVPQRRTALLTRGIVSPERSFGRAFPKKYEDRSSETTSISGELWIYLKRQIQKLIVDPNRWENSFVLLMNGLDI